jgi:hypothetical protein
MYFNSLDAGRANTAQSGKVPLRGIALKVSQLSRMW